jgi:hypothetical protein
MPSRTWRTGVAGVQRGWNELAPLKLRPARNRVGSRQRLLHTQEVAGSKPAPPTSPLGCWTTAPPASLLAGCDPRFNQTSAWSPATSVADFS